MDAAAVRLRAAGAALSAARRPRPEPEGAPRRPLALLGRPWVWALLVAALFGVPLIKGLGADHPEPPPGWDDPPLALALDDADGRPVTLADLAGHLVVLTELPLANDEAKEFSFSAINRLRKRLRGLGSAVVYVALAHGGTQEELAAELDGRPTARKPVNVFLWDEDRRQMDRLRAEAGSHGADWLLLDRHARVRGLYAGPRVHPGMDDAQRREARARLEAVFDELAADAGLLANWAGSDPEPGSPVER